MDAASIVVDEAEIVVAEDEVPHEEVHALVPLPHQKVKRLLSNVLPHSYKLLVVSRIHTTMYIHNK